MLKTLFSCRGLCFPRSPMSTGTRSRPEVDRNVDCILEVLAKHRVRATFFVLGWVAKKFPRLVREIAAAGHEIGSHGFRHRRLQSLTPEEFHRDIKESIAIVGDQAQRPIRCYRAPSFSIVRSTMWAFEILQAEGILFDSSIFPGETRFIWLPGSEALSVLA